jgi:hypothetical protein
VKSDLNRFHIPHLPDEDNIGVFTQRGAQRVSETDRILTDTPLIDDAFAIFVDEFDRIFDCDDMFASRPIDFIDNGGQRRRFTASRYPVTRTNPRSISANVWTTSGEL